MALTETVVISLGTSIVKAILGVWLKKVPVADAIGKSILDIIKSGTEDHFAARKAAREFDEIIDKISYCLIPVFNSYKEINEVSREAVIIMASKAIENSNITLDVLLKLSNDPQKLYKYILENNSNMERDLSQKEVDLYRRTLDLSTQYIIDLSSKLPDYNLKNFTEILNRFDELTKPVFQIIDKLDNLTSEIKKRDSDSVFNDFEEDYRRYIIRKYDKLTLFGADIQKGKKYTLSVAYISLDVIEDNEIINRKLTVNKALNGKEHVLIIGEAGCGKSTLLQWLAINIADKSIQKYIPDFKDTVPFLIQLRRYHDQPPTPADFIKEIAREISHKEPEKWITRILENGRAIILVDGLDEVPSNKRENVIEWIDNLISSYNIRVIVTSRPGAKEWNSIMEIPSFVKYSLSPMTMGSIEKFVKHWHYSVLEEKELENEEIMETISNKDRGNKEIVSTLINKFLHKLKNSDPLMKLSSNPLLCAMLCALHFEKNMQLPSDKISLYQACCAMLLDGRDKERDIISDPTSILTLRQKYKILGDLAYWMLKNGDTSISK